MNRHYKASLTDRVKETFEQLRRTVSGAEDALLADPDEDHQGDSLALGADGELTGAICCTYCGRLTPVGAEVCGHCGEYVADQGTDLQARLHRISRYANRSRSKDKDPSRGSLLGADTTLSPDLATHRPAEMPHAETYVLRPRSSMASISRARPRRQAESDLAMLSEDYTPYPNFRRKVARVILFLVVAQFVLIGLIYLVTH